MSQCGSFIAEKLLRVAQKTEYGVRGRQSLWIKDAWLGAGHSPPTWFDVEPRFPIRSVSTAGTCRRSSSYTRGESGVAAGSERVTDVSERGGIFAASRGSSTVSSDGCRNLGIDVCRPVRGRCNMSAQQAVALRQASLEVQLLRVRAAEKSQKAVCRQRGHTSATSHHHQKASG